MMRWFWVAVGLVASSPGWAAAPSGGFNTAAPVPLITMQRQALAPTQVGPPGYTAAPTPNQDAAAPNVRASNAPYVAPGFFTRSDQYRGEGISPSSSAQSEQDRRAKPGAGINLRMPIQ